MTRPATEESKAPLAEPPRTEHPFLTKHLKKRLTVKRAAMFIGVFTAIITLAGGVFAWLIDRSDFPTLGTGLWWAIQTVTTVGYGDVTPSHTEGRVIAAVVMLTGIGFLAVITSAITATFVEKTRERIKGSTDQQILERLDEMNARLAKLEERDGRSGSGHGD